MYDETIASSIRGGNHSMRYAMVLSLRGMQYAIRGDGHVTFRATILQGLSSETTQQVVQHIDSVVTTTNPVVLPDGSNISEAPCAQTVPHICNKAYKDVVNFDADLAQLVATCQRHTRCSSAYCLRDSNGKQQCRFGYPNLKPTQLDKDGEMKLITARNDPLINSYNPF